MNLSGRGIPFATTAIKGSLMSSHGAETKMLSGAFVETFEAFPFESEEPG